MRQTVVNPPWAAAADPVATVSASSKPGSRKWAWRSTKPGRDDDAAGVDPVGLGALEPDDAAQDPVLDDDLARALAAARRDRPARPG